MENILTFKYYLLKKKDKERLKNLEGDLLKNKVLTEKSKMKLNKYKLKI